MGKDPKRPTRMRDGKLKRLRRLFYFYVPNTGVEKRGDLGSEKGSIEDNRGQRGGDAKEE